MQMTNCCFFPRGFMCMFLILRTEKDLPSQILFISFDQDVVNGCMKKFVKTKQPIWKMLAILAADIYDQYDAVLLE